VGTPIDVAGLQNHVAASSSVISEILTLKTTIFPHKNVCKNTLTSAEEKTKSD
jgi:hypothetical protein